MVRKNNEMTCITTFIKKEMWDCDCLACNLLKTNVFTLNIIGKCYNKKSVKTKITDLEQILKD